MAKAKMKRFVGIDPGKAGGVAWVDVGSKSMERNAISFKGLTPAEVAESITDVVEDIDDCEVMIEQVNAMPKDAASNAFKFGYSAGMIEGAVIAGRKPYHFVRPAKWQGVLSCRTKGDKAVTRDKAQRLFPGFHLKITNQIADALLISEYCRQAIGNGEPLITSGNGEPLSEPEVPKKRRGRKPKGEMVVLSEKVGKEVTESFLPDEAPKKRRGRPRKVASVENSSNGQTESTPKGKRKKRKASQSV